MTLFVRFWRSSTIYRLFFSGFLLGWSLSDSCFWTSDHWLNIYVLHHLLLGIWLFVPVIRLDILLLLEHFGRLPIMFSLLCFGFVAHFVIDLNFFFRHSNILLNDTDFFCFFRSLKAEIHVVVSSWAICSDRLYGLIRRSLLLCILLLLLLPLSLLIICDFARWFALFELVKQLICLQVDFVLLIKLDLKVDDICDISEHTRV